MEAVTVAFNKPYGVLAQFTDPDGTGRKTLADFIPVPGIFAAGRLDADSEGLLILTSDGVLQHRLTDPKFHHEKTYWVQVEGAPSEKDLDPLCHGVTLGGWKTRPADVRLLSGEPKVRPRTPPVRYRASIPTAWLEIKLTEGKNRQVRRMTAVIGFPTLRLIRVGIGGFRLKGLEPGQWRELATPDICKLLERGLSRETGRMRRPSH